MGKVTEERKAGSFAEGRDRANVTLIGMPAAGKSTVGVVERGAACQTAGIRVCRCGSCDSGAGEQASEGDYRR